MPVCQLSMCFKTMSMNITSQEKLKHVMTQSRVVRDRDMTQIIAAV